MRFSSIRLHSSSRLILCGTMETIRLASMVTLAALMVSWSGIETLPFPAPDLQRCRSQEDCCTPVLDTHEPTAFEYQSFLPLRVRPAANLVDATYAAKLERAYALMRALPDTDGRSLANQAKLHCAYCDNNFYFEGDEYPLEIHQNWLFLPWHRLFIYFHERILARLIDDDTFALPYWYWDDTSAGLGSGNMVPEIYGGNPNSSLNDPDRGACAQRPNIVDLVNPLVGCLANRSDDTLRTDNARLMYTHMVTAGVTPAIFFGMPYRFGDQGGVGGGSLEVTPHSSVHLWVNFKKMSSNKLSAADPIFYAHHVNIDRLWYLWKHLPGGCRKDLSDPDWLNTRFTFYNEHGRLVHASVAQSLDTDSLRYKYQEVPIPWVTGAVDANETSSSWPKCNNDSNTDILTMVNNTAPFRKGLQFKGEPVTFRVNRKLRPWNSGKGEEILQLRGNFNWTQDLTFHAFLNLPAATNYQSLQGCREYLGCFIAHPHVGSSPNIPGRMMWKVGLKQKLKDLGMEDATQVTITISGSAFRGHVATLTLNSAKILEYAMFNCYEASRATN